MKRDICFPDYNNSIMNLSCSIMQAFGAKPKHQPLKHNCLSGIGKKDNVIFIILDGLGVNILSSYEKKNPGSFLAKNKRAEISSVFPPTTSTAITTFRTAESPIEHGIIGWSLYFKELGTAIDVLPMQDSITKTRLPKEKYPVMDYFDVKNIGESILSESKSVRCYDILPKEIKGSYYNTKAAKGFKPVPCSDFKEMMKKTASIARKKGRKLISAYSTYPDSALHKEGLGGKNINRIIAGMELEIKKLSKKLEGTSSMLIVTADHGLIDCKRVIKLNDHPKLMECMQLPKFPESRFVSFFIKNDKKKQFEKEIRKFEKDFLVMTRKEFFKKGLLGPGKKHPKIDDFIGDYVAIGIGGAQIKQHYPQLEGHDLLANHAGLTREEMIVPLIVIDFEKNQKKA
jgi:hypothetical protein